MIKRLVIVGVLVCGFAQSANCGSELPDSNKKQATNNQATNNNVWNIDLGHYLDEIQRNYPETYNEIRNKLNDTVEQYLGAKNEQAHAAYRMVKVAKNCWDITKTIAKTIAWASIYSVWVAVTVAIYNSSYSNSAFFVSPFLFVMSTWLANVCIKGLS
jgi:hypothetical protein